MCDVCGASFAAPVSSLVVGAQQHSQVLGGAWCWWPLGWHLARLPSPGEAGRRENENSRGSVLL